MFYLEHSTRRGVAYGRVFHVERLIRLATARGAMIHVERPQKLLGQMFHVEHASWRRDCGALKTTGASRAFHVEHLGAGVAQESDRSATERDSRCASSNSGAPSGTTTT